MATMQADAPWAWEGDSDPTQAARAIMVQPGFAHAARALAANTLRWSDEDHALRALFRDAGHYVAAMSTLYLHESGGLDLAHLKRICATMGFASPGRARSLLQFLQHIRFIRASEGRLPRRYTPTPVFERAWRLHLQGAVAAAAQLDRRLEAVVDRLETPAGFSTFIQIQARRLQDLASTTGDIPPFERIFMQRYAGLQIIAHIVASSAPSEFLEDAFHAPHHILAARFGVSHMHLRRLFADATDAGLLHPLGKGNYRLDQPMQQTIAFFFAVQLAELVATSLQAIKAASQHAPAER